ncbi:hypothetical protein R75461_05289 [Paraburkholderia nemoris]|nr:hypothetical protein R75461_05289 [Paraburkholderia nemoris]
MEPLRVFALSCVKQAQTRVYEGQPYRPWDRPGAHSLPPPAEPAKKKTKADRKPAHDNPNLARVITPRGKARWVLSAGTIAEVRRRISACDSLGQIAHSMGLSPSTVTRIGQKMRAAEKEKDAEAPLSALPMPAKPGLAPPDPTGPRPTSPNLPFPAIASPKADEPAMSTTCGPQLGYQEPVRTFVIDWKAKFDRMEFTSAPANCLPKKRPKRVSTMTHGQLREEMRGHTRVLPSAINCAAAPAAPAGFAGEKVLNVEQAWRETCTA